MSELLKHKDEFPSLVEKLRDPSRFLLYLGVRTQVHSCDDVHVGNIVRAARFDLPKIYTSPDEILFYRHVPKVLDVYSFVEQTYSLSLNVYWLLRDLNIRLVVTNFNDTSNTVLASVESFDMESDLGIGFLRRCRAQSTVSLPHARADFAERHRVYDLWAEHRDSIFAKRVEGTRQSYDPRQDPMF